MAELAKHGGRRTGSGRPSAHKTKAKQDAAKAQVSAREAKRQAALEAAQEHVEQAAAAGERWAIEMLLAYEIGKPGTKAQEQSDTEINLITRFPRGAVSCPHCGQEITDLGSKEVSSATPVRALCGVSDGELRHEEAGTVGQGPGPPEDDDRPAEG